MTYGRNRPVRHTSHLAATLTAETHRHTPSHAVHEDSSKAPPTATAASAVHCHQYNQPRPHRVVVVITRRCQPRGSPWLEDKPLFENLAFS